MTKKLRKKKVKVKKSGKWKIVKKAVKPLPKAITSRANAGQKAGKWKVVRLRVKPAFRTRIKTMAAKPTKRLLLVKQVVKAKKYKKNKKTIRYHRYKVRTGTR